MEIYAAVLCHIRDPWTREAYPSLMTTFAYYPESPRQTLHWTSPPPQECPATDRQCMLAREGEGFRPLVLLSVCRNMHKGDGEISREMGMKLKRRTVKLCERVPFHNCKLGSTKPFRSVLR